MEMNDSHICSHCHAGVLQDHPEEKFKDLGYLKCPICGFTLVIKKEIKDIHRIIYGK
jgi:DNA-directed RNA polymerase subunit RPC12/RpoP